MMEDAWVRPELDPCRADYPGDYVAAREYERSLWDQMQLNERLRAENERLKTLWEECEQDNKQLEAEVEKLRRDNELLREALRNG